VTKREREQVVQLGVTLPPPARRSNLTGTTIWYGSRPIHRVRPGMPGRSTTSIFGRGNGVPIGARSRAIRVIVGLVENSVTSGPP
jgi:hypothetical protein